MAINFPSAPNSGDVHTVGSIIWKYNGKAWDSLYEPSAPAQVGLSNVDNTSDEDKPVSTAQQAALDALTKDDVGLDNVDNTSDINKPVSTAQQAAIDAAGGGSSFDQDLNTTDSPTFATLTTTDTIATDVYAVDVSATGTVTADEVTTDQINSPRSLISFQPSSFERLQITSTDIRPNSFGNYDLGRSSNTFNDCYLHGTLNTVDLDASGTVTAGGFVGTPQTLTDAASITYDLADGHNAKVTLTADRILLFPTNVAEGASGVLTVTQDGTGGHALTFGTGWFISAGAAADIAALGAGEKAQVTWYAHSTSDANATILPLQ